jgi:hypothetical protein
MRLTLREFAKPYVFQGPGDISKRAHSGLRNLSSSQTACASRKDDHRRPRRIPLNSTLSDYDLLLTSQRDCRIDARCPRSRLQALVCGFDEGWAAQ